MKGNYGPGQPRTPQSDMSQRGVPDVLDADPTELIEGAIGARAAAERLRFAVREAARRGEGVRVETPDGRSLTGGGDVLAEAVILDGEAALDVGLATALLLQDVCVRLDEQRHLMEATYPVPVMVGGASLPHPGSATPEDAPEAPCPIPGYHPNHLWWGRPTDGGVAGAPVIQQRYFCKGVRYPAPQVRTPQGSP